MIDEKLKYKIGITLIKGVGTILAKNLIAYVGSVEAVFKEKAKSLEKIPGIGKVLATEIANSEVLERANKEIEFIDKHKIKAYFFTDKDYPFRLKECYDAPIMLYSKGEMEVNNGKYLGIVGTRNVTSDGKLICQTILEDLEQTIPNLTIISGMAYGVDISAHKVSVDLGLPTIGVLGHGLDRLYPAIHRNTAVRMLNNGGLISEFISGTNPDRQNFVKRNRIIAGMCDAVLVVESAEKGGALITAEYASSYNRDVFAVPGRVSDTYSKGCNNLIKYNKAALIENADDLIRGMNWEKKENKRATLDLQQSLFEDLDDTEKDIISELRKNRDGVNVNELTIILNMPYSKLTSQLLAMEFKGLVQCLPGGIYRIL